MIVVPTVGFNVEKFRSKFPEQPSEAPDQPSGAVEHLPGPMLQLAPHFLVLNHPVCDVSVHRSVLYSTNACFNKSFIAQIFNETLVVIEFLCKSTKFRDF